MKNVIFNKLAAISFLSLFSLGVNAQDLSSQNEALENLKSSVVSKEQLLADSQAQLKEQTETMECLGQLLQRFTDCENANSAQPNPEQLAICLEEQKMLLQNCEGTPADLL